MRKILAVIIGTIFGGIFIQFGEFIGMKLFPSAVPFPQDISKLDEYFSQIPLSALIVVTVSWGIGAFVASLMATWIQGRTNWKPMLVSVGILQLFAYLNMLTFTHPKWMWIAATVEFIPLGFIAYWLIRKRKQEHENG